MAVSDFIDSYFDNFDNATRTVVNSNVYDAIGTTTNFDVTSSLSHFTFSSNLNVVINIDFCNAIVMSLLTMTFRLLLTATSTLLLTVTPVTLPNAPQYFGEVYPSAKRHRYELLTEGIVKYSCIA